MTLPPRRQTSSTTSRSASSSSRACRCRVSISAAARFAARDLGSTARRAGRRADRRVVYAIAGLAGLSPASAAALALAATMLATGCLHEDGLSDVADGFGGGKTRERKLEIMRDSRIGAYGAARWSCRSCSAGARLPHLADAGRSVLRPGRRARAPRARCCRRFMHLLPPARADGLSAGAGSVSQETAIVAAAHRRSSRCCSARPRRRARRRPPARPSSFRCSARSACNQIGGQTGDTIGALQQIGEITVLSSLPPSFPESRFGDFAPCPSILR